MAETNNKMKKFYNWILLGIIVGVVIFLNIIGTFIYSRIDMTEDERYSLSQGSIEFLEKMTVNEAGSKKNEKGNIGFKLASTPVVGDVLLKFTPRGIIRKSVEDVYSDKTQVSEDLVQRYFDLF